MSENGNHRHVGDGVYAEFDGWGLNIRVNDHRNPVAVYLEPEVLSRLTAFFLERSEASKPGPKPSSKPAPEETQAQLVAALVLAEKALFEAVEIAPLDRMPRLAGDALQLIGHVFGRSGKL